MGKFEQELDTIAQKNDIPDHVKKAIIEAAGRCEIDAERQKTINMTFG